MVGRDLCVRLEAQPRGGGPRSTNQQARRLASYVEIEVLPGAIQPLDPCRSEARLAPRNGESGFHQLAQTLRLHHLSRATSTESEEEEHAGHLDAARWRKSSSLVGRGRVHKQGVRVPSVSVQHPLLQVRAVGRGCGAGWVGVGRGRVS